LFIWYQDLSTDENAPVLGVAPVQLREACLSGKFGDRLGCPPTEAIWCPQQSIRPPFPGFPFTMHHCQDLEPEANECYSILTGAGDLSGEDEDMVLKPFRTALQKVALELNAHNWSNILQCSNDFVVLASDYIGEWIAGDMQASIPKKRLAELKAHGLIPPDWLDFDAKAAKAAYEAELQAEGRARQEKVEAELRDAERAHQKKVREGGACPKCGFSFGWNGTECSHCKFIKK
jgi:hypothetical protein